HRDPASGDDDAGEVEDPWDAPYPLSVTSISRPVMRVECGSDFSFAITTANELWCWGCNADGQLGLGHTNDVKDAERIDLFGAATPAVSVAAGSRHSMVLTSELAVYVCGSTGHGRLGLGKAITSTPSINVWTLNGSLSEQCNSIACGESHTAAICGGLIMSFGAGSFGRLGHGDLLDTYLPTLVRNFDEVAKQVACGAFHTVALTTKGRLWSWGTGCPLGYMNDADNSVVSIPRRLNFEFQGPVLQIAAGPFHTLVLCTQGRVACWGNGSHGRIGMGPDMSNCPKPKFLAVSQPGAGGGEFREAILREQILDICEKKPKAGGG
ncbi:unnamed protein product, partial [Amoebophrya sp. A25]